MTAPIDKVIAALQAHGCDPRPNGAGWKALCPAHPDRNPSLDVKEGDKGDGTVVMTCRSQQCAPEAITAAVGLSMKDLFPEKASNGNGLNGHRSDIATTYPYLDANGKLLFEVVRMSPKGFRQRRPDGNGGWTWNLKGVESRPLYRLPEVLAAVKAKHLVWVVEGEKDADRLQAALPEGEVATTCPGGAGKWREEHTAALAGTEVMVVADRDGPGRKHAREVADALEAAALVGVTIVEPIAGKDAADHLAAGHGPEDFQRLAADDQGEGEAPAPNPIVSRIRQVTEANGADETVAVDDDAFWDALPALAHIRTYARAQLASPWATFGVIAARVVCQVPPTVTLPPIIFGHASLNLTVALVGASGGGKGGTEAVGAAALRFPGGPTFERHTLGTGHAIAHGFGHWDKTAGAVERHATSVLFTVQEVDHIAGHANMSGSTTLAELRRFSMGENLGSFYVDPTKRVEIPAHTYRGGIIVGVQPDRAAVLLEDAGGGTPQRFLWLPTTDPAMPDQAPDRPAPIDWSTPTDLPAADPHTGLRPIPVCDTATHAIRQAHRDHMQGHGDPLDGHALLTRERTAAALALLDGRYGITDNDWNLAATVMAVSDNTRTSIVTTLQAKARAANQNRGRADAEREEAKDNHRSARVARNIGTKLEAHGDWMGGSQLRKTLASNDRAVFETAIDHLRQAGQIEPQEVPGTGQPGWRYRWIKR